jgi:hypothetical protein
MAQNGGITIDKDGQKVILHDADEAKLAAMGKKQEMERNFNIFSMFGMCFCIIATVCLTWVYGG